VDPVDPADERDWEIYRAIMERDKKITALRDSLRAVLAELSHIDAVLARRTALDGFNSRAEKIEHAINTAKERDAALARIAEKEGQLCGMRKQLQRARGLNGTLREAVEWALENGDEINLFGGDGSIWKAELRRRVGEGNEK
jgi:hypothetical protein